MLKIILDFDRWELAGGKDIVSMESIRVRKYHRTVSVLNGTGTLLIDLDDKYEVVEIAFRFLDPLSIH